MTKATSMPAFPAVRTLAVEGASGLLLTPLGFRTPGVIKKLRVLERSDPVVGSPGLVVGEGARSHRSAPPGPPCRRGRLGNGRYSGTWIERR
jgi:hypothetical protein